MSHQTAFVQQTYTREKYCGPISFLIGCFIPCGFWICLCPIDEVEVRRGPKTVVYTDQRQAATTQVVVNVPYQQGGHMGVNVPSQGGYTQANIPQQQQQQQYQPQQYQPQQQPVQYQQPLQAPPAYQTNVPVVASAPDYGTQPVQAEAYAVQGKNQY